MADRYGPVSMPDREWRKPEIRHALRDRDAGNLLSLVQKHAGVSQARLATATGIGQGRLNEIINRHRQVARLDVLERIAGGLAMPDNARVLFGLAPVHAETLTGHAEISRVASHQLACLSGQRHGEVLWRMEALPVPGTGEVPQGGRQVAQAVAKIVSATHRREPTASAGRVRPASAESPGPPRGMFTLP